MRIPSAGAGLAVLLMVWAAPAVDASPTSLVVLTVADQGGAAFLEWALAGVTPPPPIEAWIITRVADDGQSTEVVLPATASSYLDPTVEPGRTYVYTVAYREVGGQVGPPSNPAVFYGGCPIKCPPVDFEKPFPWIDLDCICIE